MPAQAISAATPPSAQAVRVVAIVVLYRQRPEESKTLRSMEGAARATPSELLDLQIVIADNTPGGQAVGVLPKGALYRAYKNNPGLALPFNDALQWATENGFDWLLTLDQDTELPPTFFERLIRHLWRLAGDPVVASVVPRIEDGGRPISPLRFQWGFLPRIFGPDAPPLAGRHASAVNSASLHRVTALQEIGGYDFRFPLHNSDTSLFLRLDRAGKRVAIASDIVVAHEMSMLQRDARISPERYRQTLLDECRFWDLEMGALGRLERLLRLLGRVVKAARAGESEAMQRVTRAELARRLLVRRSKRLGESGDTPH